jgi:methylglyoxal synthase
MAVQGPTIALISHDALKSKMVEFALRHKRLLQGFNIIATGTTGSRVADATGLPVTRMLSGPMGGDAQISALVATGFCHSVIFLVDPLSAHPHEPDIQGFLRICNVHNIPVATNVATADILIHAIAGGGRRSSPAVGGGASENTGAASHSMQPVDGAAASAVTEVTNQ